MWRTGVGVRREIGGRQFRRSTSMSHTVPHADSRYRVSLKITVMGAITSTGLPLSRVGE
jgi:hypothetical protein